ncbi:hypothetical protein, partial [Nonomuraea rosea]|uniref:hypothetical protein n=1 Tax=Nonomuraea rosea TaxID=638574 RepID=UPI003CD09081
MEVHPWLMMRSAALPARLLGGLGHPDLPRLAGRLLAADGRLSYERRHFEQCAAAMRTSVLRLGAERRALARRCLKAVRTGVPLADAEIRLLESLGLGGWVRRWQSAVVEAAAARAAARSAYAAARLVTRRGVAEAYDEEAVRHAAFVADPGFYRAMSNHPLARRPGDGTARRSRLLTATAHRHLRNLAASTGSGPVLYARLAPESADALGVGEPGTERVMVEAGGWLIRRLQTVLDAAAPERDLRVWPSPLFREPPSAGDREDAPAGPSVPQDGPERVPVLERVVDGARVRVPEGALLVWRAASGGRTVGELSDELGLSVEAVAGHARASRAAVILSRSRLPAAEPHPLTALAGVSPAPAGVVEIAELRTRYERAPWPERARWFEAARQAVADLGDLGDLGGPAVDRGGAVLDRGRAGDRDSARAVGGVAAERGHTVFGEREPSGEAGSGERAFPGGVGSGQREASGGAGSGERAFRGGVGAGERESLGGREAGRGVGRERLGVGPSRYSDREIFHECRSSAYSERVTIGGAALARLRDALSSVLPLCALGALLAREDARDAVRAVLGGRSAPLARLAATNLRTEPTRMRALTAVLAELVAQRYAGGGHDARVSSADGLMAQGYGAGGWDERDGRVFRVSADGVRG